MRRAPLAIEFLPAAHALSYFRLCSFFSNHARWGSRSELHSRCNLVEEHWNFHPRTWIYYTFVNRANTLFLCILLEIKWVASSSCWNATCY